MIKLIGVDVDGTLLDSDGRMPDANRDAIHEAVRRGIHVALVTGRSYPFARPIADPLPSSVTLIVSSGAVERATDGTRLARRFLSRDVAHRVLDATRPYRDAAALIFDRDTERQIIFESMDWEHPGRKGYWLRNQLLIAQSLPLEEALTEDPIQLMFNGYVDPMRDLAPRLRGFGDDFSVSVTEYERRNFTLLDVTAPDATKGRALAWRAEQLHVGREEVMAVGDNFNDLDMLEYAGLPVVMGNAVEGLTQRGWHVTGHQNEAGLAQAIERFALNSGSDKVWIFPEARMTTMTVPDVLVSTDWVAQHRGDSNVRVVEVDVDTAAYDQGHVTNAVGWNWTTELCDTLVRDIVPKGKLEDLMGRSGITPETTIVLYGDNNNWFAAWAFWQLKIYGHQDVRIMNGGRKKWLAEGRELETTPAKPAAATYTAKDQDQSLRAFLPEVQSTYKRSDTVLVDVRSPQEFTGEILSPPGLPETCQRGGHIPGAKSIPWAKACNDDGTFKSREDLLALYGAQGVTPDKNVIAYCRIGERSSHTWFVLKHLLGFDNVKNYDGSWTEWGNLVGAPVEK